MRDCDIKFVNKEITPFGGLSLFFKMLERCHFDEHLEQSGIPVQGSNRGYKPLQLILSCTRAALHIVRTFPAHSHTAVILRCLNLFRTWSAM